MAELSVANPQPHQQSVMVWPPRRPTYWAVFALSCSIAFGIPMAETSAAPETEEALPADLDAAIANGLAFLARQQRNDGSFEGGGPKVGMTGLSLLAFLAAGDAPEAGRYGLAVHAAGDYLLSQQNADGYFGSGDRGMYIHAIATLALTQLYGVEPGFQTQVRIRAVLVKAVRVILDAQKAPKSDAKYVGGWRYERNSADSDLSLSGWNALALRAARDVGIEVPDDALAKAAEFVIRCYNDSSKGFGYQPGNDAQPGETGIGVLCLLVLSAAEKQQAALDKSTDFLAAHPIDENSPFPYYAIYYVTQAAFQRGGQTWVKTGRRGLEWLIRQQEKDGGWPQSKTGQEPGRVYATAMAVQTLAVPYRLLPIYQR